ncbi:P-loop NTPase fold protein [Lentzea rhizosphaerae]|uniref:P-loop NTPase fold protein n=1 Tax=Lentzea rhizosphaerae TaxID=2041025 RepID=A0ABV8C0V3_9PSEU
MTSAEPPQMELERTIEFELPINDLAVNTQDAGSPLLQVFFDGQPPEIVLANTGERYGGSTREHWEKVPGPRMSVSFGDLDAVADRADIVLRPHARGRETRRLSGHSTQITTLALCPTSGEPLLVSGSEGGSVRIWDPRTGELIRQSQSSRVSALVVYLGPDGRPRIASGGRTGRLRIWNPRLPVPPLVSFVSTRGFSDRVASEDLLDRGTLVDGLRDVLRPDEDDDGPTVLTVEGAWGSGKSTLLELLKNKMPTPPTAVRKRLWFTVCQADWMLYSPPAGMKPPRQQPTKIKPMVKPLVVSFNPWRHQSSEQVWAGLAKVVTEAAESAIMPHRNNVERYWFTRNAKRVDRRHLQRQLWKRILSPLLTLAGLGLGVSVLNALAKWNFDWAWWVTAGLATAGVLHTALRYLFGKASAFLPGELFAGPVVSNAFSGTTTDPLIRDPYYNARSGYLYLVQHDVRELLRDLKAYDYRVILLIDDLDRCTPRTTAQVFEAINVFLSDDFPATRFVLGLDTAVVAAHVDHAYKELADAKIVTHPDDPSPGWTFLRKLVQLPVRLPRTTADNVDQVLLAQLGPVHRETQVVHPEGVAAADSGLLTESATVEVIEQEIIAIERHPDVREHLRQRLRAQPEQSVREEKRLLNTWQFYLRVLQTSDVEEACQLVAVAEIAVRWPAYLHRLRGGWQDLANAVGDDVQWGATIAKLGFAYSDREAAANLRELLLDCDAQAVASLANRLF